jgi:hypothetical protein
MRVPFLCANNTSCLTDEEMRTKQNKTSSEDNVKSSISIFQAP